MEPNDIAEWLEFLARAPLNTTLLIVTLGLLYITYKFVFQVVNEIRTTLTVNTMLRDELVKKLKEREDYINELECLVNNLEGVLSSHGISHAQNKRNSS
jgi:hypothetical protein